MIRVNLLPIKQARRRSAGRTQLIVFAALIAAQIAVLGLLYFIEASEADKLTDEVAVLQQQVNKDKNDVKNAEQLQQKEKQLTQQLAVLKELEARRTGPVRVLDELQAVLSPPRNEEDLFVQLQNNWNVDWDSRRLWIESLEETDGSFSMEGLAVNADDVAEFLQRLSTARHFSDVELKVVKAEKKGGAADGSRTVSFSLSGKIAYNPVAESEETPQGS
jgi:type IV pilus assembly protein PilN